MHFWDLNGAVCGADSFHNMISKNRTHLDLNSIVFNSRFRRFPNFGSDISVMNTVFNEYEKLSQTIFEMKSTLFGIFKTLTF